MRGMTCWKTRKKIASRHSKRTSKILVILLVIPVILLLIIDFVP